MPHELAFLCIIWLAVALDALAGEPPSAVHPVAWMGRLIAVFSRIAPKRGAAGPFAAGMAFTVLGMVLVGTAGWAVHLLLWRLPLPLALIGEAVALKLMFSLRGLLSAGREVSAALDAGDLSEARRRVAWHLVSRDTSNLTESQVAAATIESLAENASDSMVAPLLFYAVFGLPGAFACRFINTCDAMLGYRDVEREWLGKFPARLDDVVHFVPARLTALCLLLAGPLRYGHLANAVLVWRRDRWLTASPNAGQPMSMAAGVLSVELEKVDCYRLGAGQRVPVAGDIPRAVWLMADACGLFVVAMTVCLLILG